MPKRIDLSQSKEAACRPKAIMGHSYMRVMLSIILGIIFTFP
jgi:hypothetical protein